MVSSTDRLSEYLNCATFVCHHEHMTETRLLSVKDDPSHKTLKERLTRGGVRGRGEGCWFLRSVAKCSAVLAESNSGQSDSTVAEFPWHFCQKMKMIVWKFQQSTIVGVKWSNLVLQDLTIITFASLCLCKIMKNIQPLLSKEKVPFSLEVNCLGDSVRHAHWRKLRNSRGHVNAARVSPHVRWDPTEEASALMDDHFLSGGRSLPLSRCVCGCQSMLMTQWFSTPGWPFDSDFKSSSACALYSGQKRCDFDAVS